MVLLDVVYPERKNLTRARFLHLALPGSSWSLCERARVGETAEGVNPLTSEWNFCPRCATRQKFLDRGERVRRKRS